MILKWAPRSNSLLASSSDDLPSAGNDQEVRIWDTTKKGFTENPVKVYKDPSGDVTGIDWSPNGNYLAIVDKVSMLHVWNINTGSEANSYQDIIFKGGYSELSAVGWSSDSASIAVGESWSQLDYLPYATIKIINFCERWCFFQGL